MAFYDGISHHYINLMALIFNMSLGSIPAAYGVSPFISIALIFGGLFLFLKFFG